MTAGKHVANLETSTTKIEKPPINETGKHVANLETPTKK